MESFYFNLMEDCHKLENISVLIESLMESLSFKSTNINESVPYFLLCPFCKSEGIMTTQKGITPIYCYECGETSPFNKLNRTLEKVKKLKELSRHNEDEIVYILREQMVVILATSIEVFLRDIYSTMYNLIYIKRNSTLIKKFMSEVKNDFINMGKIKKRFNELEISFSSNIDDKILKEINLLLLKRNVVVHNAGIVDKSFLSSSG
ncbi:hypothetical protein FC678_25120, partial [Peribacillus simplex]